MKIFSNDMLQAIRLPKFFLLLSVASWIVLSSCKTEPPGPTASEPGIFELNFLARVGGQVFEKDSEFENILGQRFSVEVFRLYLSDLTLVREDGKDTLIAETLLLDFAEEEIRKTTHGEGIYSQFSVPSGKYKGIRFGIGVPEAINHSDPTDFAADHPLSISQGMHWNWTSGYIFLKIDGRIDSSANGMGPLTQGLAYHTGTDNLYRQLSYTESEHAFEVQPESELTFEMELDLNRMFYTNTDTINMVEQFLTHTMPVGSEAFQLAEKVTDNLVNNAMYKVPF